MLPERLGWITEAFEPEGDPWLLFQIAQELQADGNLEGAATVYDRAYALEPHNDKIRYASQAVLDRLEVREHGLVFRYVPAGPFLMGSRDGDPDEQPLHPVWLSPYWIAETPMHWEDYCRLLGWLPPPEGVPGDGGDANWRLFTQARLCQQYSEVKVAESDGEEAIRLSRPSRWQRDPNRFRYDLKPVVGVAWQEAEELAQRISTVSIRYALPSEAQWEKAVRGGLIGARYAWGDDPPSSTNCDCNNFHAVAIAPMKSFSPNGYGLYAMNGGVWEWTADWYDRDYYRLSPAHDPTGPAKGKEKVLRGGSWADCAEVATNTFRMSRGSCGWRQEEETRDQLTPTIGFRLCRTGSPTAIRTHG